MNHRRERGRILVVLTLIVMFNCGGTIGCDGVFEEFRAASSADLKAGVNTILDGIVSGAFAVFEPDDVESTNSNE